MLSRRPPHDRNYAQLYIFSFEQDYIEDANRPTLSLSFKGQGRGLVIPTRAVTARLPVFFSNLLPEGRLREYLAARAGVKQHREFFLLSVLGADLPGALTVAPMDQPEQSSAEHAADRDSHEGAPETALRFSLAGVQLKFSAILEASGGFTIPAEGIGGSWIVKLPSSRFSSVPENEYAMMALARSVGIEVPSTKLIDIGEIRGLPTDAIAMRARLLLYNASTAVRRARPFTWKISHRYLASIPRTNTITVVKPISPLC